MNEHIYIPTLNNYVRTHNKRDRVVNREIYAVVVVHSTQQNVTGLSRLKKNISAQSGSYSSAVRSSSGRNNIADVQNNS